MWKPTRTTGMRKKYGESSKAPGQHSTRTGSGGAGSQRNARNDGMAFEYTLDLCNIMYKSQRIAVINKRPTPVKILEKKGARVTGFLEKNSTVDYDGHVRQRGIAFEAKSTIEERFSLKNIEEHQIKYLEDCHMIGGAICFLIVEMQAYRRTFLIPFPVLSDFWERAKAGRRGEQSLTIGELEREAFEVMPGRVPLDYLAVVRRIWGDPTWDIEAGRRNAVTMM